MQQVYQSIRRYVDENRQPMLTLWEELVNIDSGSRQIDGVNAVGAILAREMRKSGMSVRTVAMANAGDLLVGEWNTQSPNPPFVFIGHMDTVFQAGTAAANPFSIDQDGHAHGPGVLDMKAGLVIALYTIKALAAADYTDRPVKCVFAGDEENLHTFSNTPELMAAEVTGAAAAFNFETGYLDDGFVVGRKGGGILSIHVKGIAAHSGIAPEKGRSAILEAASKVIELEGQNDIPRGKLINCGVISGGKGENTIPDECAVRIGIRFPTTAIKNELLDAVRNAAQTVHVADVSATCEINSCMECMETTDGVTALFDHLQKTARACGYGEIHSMKIGGVSDSGITVVNGVPTICGMGARGTGSHTADEYAVVESLFERCVLAASAVYDYH